MVLLKQGAWTNNVRRIDSEHIRSEAFLLSTDFEGSVSLTIKTDTFEITEARWAIHRAPDMECRGEGSAPMLIGESAYVEDRKNSISILPDYSKTVDFNTPPGGWKGKDAHKTAVLSEPEEEVSQEWRKIRELYLETIRGAYQAEYYLLEERKYKDLEAYEMRWIGGKPEYCRPYTIDTPSVEDWPEYTGTTEHYRAYDLYNKYIQATLIEDASGKITATGAYNDSFHEMSVQFLYDRETGVIEDADACVVRVPFRACWELDKSYVDGLVGQNIKELKKRDIGKVSGGKYGCYHLVDVVADVVDLAKGF